MDRWDWLALLGIVLFGLGLALLAPWLGVATAGLLLTAAGVAGGILAERPARPDDQAKGGS